MFAFIKRILLFAAILFIPFFIARLIPLMLLAVDLASWLIYRYQRRHIIIERISPELRAHSGDSVRSVLRITNTGIFAVHNWIVKDSPGDLFSDEDPVWDISLKPKHFIDLSREYQCRQRGIHTLGPVQLLHRDPFGVKHRSVQLEIPGRVVIFPAFHRLLLPGMNGIAGGSYRVNDPLFRDISRFRNMREYRPGDELRLINWKQRKDPHTLWVREFESTIDFTVNIFLNLDLEDYPVKGRYPLAESAISFSASLIHYFAAKGVRFALLSNAGHMTVPGRGMVHAGELLRQLAFINFLEMQNSEAEDQTQIDPVSAVKQGEHICYVGPVLDKKRAVNLRALKSINITARAFYLNTALREAESVLPYFYINREEPAVESFIS